MDNQHKKIAGYRDLTQSEIDLMNEIKAHEKATAALLAKVREGAGAHGHSSEALRQIAIARTEFEHAFMRLVRGVAQPQSPWI